MRARVRGFDGSAEEKARIEKLRTPAPGSWSQLPAAAALDRELGQVTALHVLAVLARYRNSATGLCIPSIDRMAAELEIERRSVQRHLSKLIERGYVVAVPRFKHGRQTSNGYVILFPDAPAPAAQSDDAGEIGRPSQTTEKALSEAANQSAPRATHGVTPAGQHGGG